MTTLKQLLEKKLYRDTLGEKVCTVDEINAIIQQWLLQKRQNYTEARLSSITNDAIEYYTAKEITISQLLEELK